MGVVRSAEYLDDNAVLRARSVEQVTNDGKIAQSSLFLDDNGVLRMRSQRSNGKVWIHSAYLDDNGVRRWRRDQADRIPTCACLPQYASITWPSSIAVTRDDGWDWIGPFNNEPVPSLHAVGTMWGCTLAASRGEWRYRSGFRFVWYPLAGTLEVTADAARVLAHAEWQRWEGGEWQPCSTQPWYTCGSATHHTTCMTFGWSGTFTGIYTCDDLHRSFTLTASHGVSPAVTVRLLASASATDPQGISDLRYRGYGHKHNYAGGWPKYRPCS